MPCNRVLRGNARKLSNRFQKRNSGGNRGITGHIAKYNPRKLTKTSKRGLFFFICRGKIGRENANNYFTSDNVHYVKWPLSILKIYLFTNIIICGKISQVKKERKWQHGRKKTACKRIPTPIR